MTLAAPAQISTASSLALFLPVLQKWASLVQDRMISPTTKGQPWWLSPGELVRSFATAASHAGWEAKIHINAEEEFAWDLHLMEPNGDSYAFWCSSALQSVGNEDNGLTIIQGSVRISRMGASELAPSEGQERMLLLFVIPYARTEAGDDGRVATLITQWLFKQPFQAEDGEPSAHAYVDGTRPFHRNLSDWAFPGVGLMLQPLLPDD